MRVLSKLAGGGRRKGIVGDILGDNGWREDDGLLIPPSGRGWNADREKVDASFSAIVANAYKASGPVFACSLARLLTFSEARLAYQELVGGRPGDLFWHPNLSLLEAPWPNGQTGDLLARMEQDASLAGNCYLTTAGVAQGRHVRRLRPDWVTIISGVAGEPDESPYDVDATVLAYIYRPPGKDPTLITPDRMTHYAPVPDPDAQWRGMSWLSPILRETASDVAATKHKLQFFKNGGTPSYVVKYPPDIEPETFKEYVDLFNEQHIGVDNAYKVLHIGGGADPTTVGTNMQQLEFKALQGASETRIAAASGVGAVIAQLSEGMQGSSLNAGNYQAARRRFSDMLIRPLWRMACGSLAKLAPPPADRPARLTVDTADVAFLKEDEKDAAEIQGKQAETIARLSDSGYTPESVIAAVTSGDFRVLKHSGLYSVQLQQAGSGQPPAPEGGAS